MNYNKKTVQDVDVKGKKVLLRCDFNVPQDKETGAITSGTRIVSAVITAGAMPEDSIVATRVMPASANRRANSSPTACIKTGST